jgi:Integrase zinc binding domain
VLELTDYDIEIHHFQGKDNGRADALSRREDHDTGERDNEDVVVLPDHLFARTMRTKGLVQDDNVIKRWVDPHHLKYISGRWTKDDWQVITGSLEDRRAIIKSLHDLPAYGHPGISRTVDFVKRSYWWPGLRRDVAEYVQGCGECQRHKVNNKPTKAPLQPIFPPEDATPFGVVTLDFITKLPLSNGYDSILTITDHSCTKMVHLHFIPCTKVITVEGTARLFLDTIVR